MFIISEWAIEATILMKQKHITQKQLANDLEYSEQYISMLFNGKKSSPIAEKKIMEYLTKHS